MYWVPHTITIVDWMLVPLQDVLKSNLQCGETRRWHLWEVIKSWGWIVLISGISALLRRIQRNNSLSFHSVIMKQEFRSLPPGRELSSEPCLIPELVQPPELWEISVVHKPPSLWPFVINQFWKHMYLQFLYPLDGLTLYHYLLTFVSFNSF